MKTIRKSQAYEQTLGKSANRNLKNNKIKTRERYIEVELYITYII